VYSSSIGCYYCDSCSSSAGQVDGEAEPFALGDLFEEAAAETQEEAFLAKHAFYMNVFGAVLLFALVMWAANGFCTFTDHIVSCIRGRGRGRGQAQVPAAKSNNYRQVQQLNSDSEADVNDTLVRYTQQIQ
jgi:hypothetical protein